MNHTAFPENNGGERKQRALDGKLSKITVNMFVFICCGLFLAFVVGLMVNPLGTQRSIFLMDMNDLFADFFNLLRYIAERDPYFCTKGPYSEKAYFPLIYMILYPFSQLDDFATMYYTEIFINSRMGIMLCFVFIGFSVFLLFAALNRIIRKYSVPFIALIGLALSYIFIFSVERANVVIISAACVGFFICDYDSEHRHRRIWAAISLALAATLKVYPILFGFLYLAKKQYRELFFCSAVTLLLVFVPYLFFKGGFDNIPQNISNLMGYSAFYEVRKIYPRFGLSNLLYCCSVVLEFPEKTTLSLLSVSKIITIIAGIVAITSSCLEENRWLKISLLTMTVLLLPTNSVLYCGLYMFPMIIMFFPTMRERTRIFNIFIFIVFIMFLNPFQIGIISNERGIPTSINYIIGNISILSLYMVLLIFSGKSSVTKCIAWIRRKRISVAQEEHVGIA